MSKKKSKITKIIKSAIKILDSGEIKVKSDEKIDISQFVESTIKDTKISRLEGLPSKEEIIIDDTNNYRLETSANRCSMSRIVHLLSEINTNESQTILIPVSKKKALKLKNIKFIDWLSKTSTFNSVYKNCKDSWSELNTDDNTEFTNVLFMPNIYIFIDNNGRKLRKKPIKVNILIVAIPTPSNAKSGIETMNPNEYTRRIIDDSVEACIKLGLKNIITSPFIMPILRDDAYFTSEYWHNITERQKTIENIKSFIFSINDDDLYIVFCKSRNN